jgi:hypothetical protein
MEEITQTLLFSARLESAYVIFGRDSLLGTLGTRAGLRLRRYVPEAEKT